MLDGVRNEGAAKKRAKWRRLSRLALERSFFPTITSSQAVAASIAMQATVRQLQASPTLKLAIVGSGPSAFYAAARVLSSHEQAEVHMYERLPTPNGLVRWGVAPDHPDVKVS